MRNLDELNMYAGQSSKGTRPIADLVKATEEQLEAKLPSDYIMFLEFCNGGYPKLKAVTYTEEGKQYTWELEQFFGFYASDNSPRDIRWAYSHRWPFIPATMLPIASDPFGNLFCLRLDEMRYGSVVLCMHDMANRRFVEVAASFEGFIDSLAPYSIDT